MYAFKLASIASNKIEEEKSLASLRNFLSGHGYILNSTSEEEFENFMSIWSLMSPNIQMSIVQELLEKDGNVKNSSLGVCTQDLIQASSSSLVGSVKGKFLQIFNFLSKFFCVSSNALHKVRSMKKTDPPYFIYIQAAQF